MKAQITVNGKSIEIEISRNQAKELGLIDRETTGYERVKKDETYYVISTECDSTTKITEFNDQVDEQCYNKGNYYSNKTIAENNARADRLLRQLRRWQAQNDKAISISDWKNNNILKYYIDYDCFNELFFVTYAIRYRCPNTIYFTSREKAKEAIEVFKDELKWYYTKYQQRLDEE